MPPRPYTLSTNIRSGRPRYSGSSGCPQQTQSHHRRSSRSRSPARRSDRSTRPQSPTNLSGTRPSARSPARALSSGFGASSIQRQHSIHRSSPNSEHATSEERLPTAAEIRAQEICLPEAPIPQGLHQVFVKRDQDQLIWSCVGIDGLFTGKALDSRTPSTPGTRNWYDPFKPHHGFYPKSLFFGNHVLRVLKHKEYSSHDLSPHGQGFRCEEVHLLTKLHDFALCSITHLATVGKCQLHIKQVVMLAQVDIDPLGTCMAAGPQSDAPHRCSRLKSLVIDRLVLLSMLLAWTSCGKTERTTGFLELIDHIKTPEKLDPIDESMMYEMTSSWICDWDVPRWGVWVDCNEKGLAFLAAYVEARVPSWVCWGISPMQMTIQARDNGLPEFMRAHSSQARHEFEHVRRFMEKLAAPKSPPRIEQARWTNFVPPPPTTPSELPAATQSALAPVRRLTTWGGLRHPENGEDPIAYHEELLYNGNKTRTIREKPASGSWMECWEAPKNSWRLWDWVEEADGQWTRRIYNHRDAVGPWENNIDEPWRMRYIYKYKLVMIADFYASPSDANADVDDYMDANSPYLCQRDIDRMRQYLLNIPLPDSDVSMDDNTFEQVPPPMQLDSQMDEFTKIRDEEDHEGEDTGTDLADMNTGNAGLLSKNVPQDDLVTQSSVSFMSITSVLQLLGMRFPKNGPSSTNTLSLPVDPIPSSGVSSLPGAWKCLGHVVPDHVKTMSFEDQLQHMSISAHFASSLVTFFGQLATYGRVLHSECPVQQYCENQVALDSVKRLSMDSRAGTQQSEPDSLTWMYNHKAWPDTRLALLKSGVLRHWRVERIVCRVQTRNQQVDRQVFSLTSTVFGGCPVIIYDGAAVMAILLGRRGVTYRSILMFCVRHGIRFAAPDLHDGRGISHLSSADIQQYQWHEISSRRSQQFGVRKENFRLTPDTYAEWKHVTQRMLTNPRIMRACLRRGGPLWRIAVQHGDFETILGKPSDDSLKFSIGESFLTSTHTFWDDDFEPEEEAKLLGMFYVSKPGNRRSMIGESENRSLWPLSHTWEGSGLDTVTWCPAAEEFYVRLDRQYSRVATTEDLPAGKSNKAGLQLSDVGRASAAQPRTGKHWRDWIRENMKCTLRVWIAAHHQSRKFLENLVDNCQNC